MTIESQLPAGLQGPVAERMQAAASEQVVRRIWDRDGTLWAPEGTPEVTDRLGWLDIAERLAPEVEDLTAFGAEVRDAGITDAVLLGMGGSSLGPEVLRRSFGDGAIRLHVLDSTHPDQIRATRDALDLDKTLFIVSSKSGGTIETMSQFKYFHSLQGDGAHYVAVTDPGTLAREARRRARLPARVRERPEHRRPLLGAVLLRARPRRDRRLRRRRRARHRARGDGGLPGRAGQPRAAAGRRARRAGAPAAATS